jgi:GntR family transcriptional repressor for pyruvate dehydrogenase complex
MKVRPAEAAAGDMPRLDAGQEIMAGLLHFIRQRGFEPGERLPSERELAERFEVSRNTIRELLTTLEWFRMVERRPSSGVYLRQEATDSSLEALVMTSGLGIDLNEQEVLQSMETRYLLELQAVRLCCQRRTEADVAAMKDILDKTAAQIESGRNIAELDTAFHLAIVAGTQNAVLVRVVKPFYLLSGRQRSHYFADVARARKSLADHRKLFDAIANRDEDAALGVLMEHLGVVENYWRRALAPVKAKRQP